MMAAEEQLTEDAPEAAGEEANLAWPATFDDDEHTMRRVLTRLEAMA